MTTLYRNPVLMITCGEFVMMAHLFDWPDCKGYNWVRNMNRFLWGER